MGIPISSIVSLVEDNGENVLGGAGCVPRNVFLNMFCVPGD